MNRINTLFIFITVLLVSSCASRGLQIEYLLDPSPFNHEVYKKLRTGKIYMRLETIMIADVIYMDKGLRRAWADEQAKAKKLSEKEKGVFIENAQAKAKDGVEFILAIYTAQTEWNDFSEKDSRWTISLENGADGLVKHSPLVKVELNNTILRDHIPFSPRFREFYRASFPGSKAPGQPLSLHISSSLGEVDLLW